MPHPGYIAYMRRCPQCGSSDLYPATGAYLGALYRCKGCGYQGAFVVDSEEEMPHPQEPDNASHRMDIPLWARILALIFLVIFVWLAVK
ncbi:MAG: hypothetical protein D5R96_03305 [Methanocalculus sp. MSAO_Arc2]|nr:MAG: hypothetical protein D5R96_03305 [Methanocalculus sp. MSAO_Arc2]